jgi:TonB family protein
VRASSDFFVVGMTGLGTALFLSQLLIVSRQIVSANNHVQAELAAEKMAVPISWMHPPLRPILHEILWQGQCCPPPMPPRFPPGSRYVQPAPLPIAHPMTSVRPKYPQRALEHNVDGYVEFVFMVAPNGSPLNPKVSAEVPQGWGFAEAATALFAKWKFQPEPPGRTVRYRMSFVHPNDQGFLPFGRDHR